MFEAARSAVARLVGAALGRSQRGTEDAERDTYYAPPRLLDLRGLGCERDTPPLLLAQLRAIDPAAELIDAGEGRWWVGAVKTPVTPERRKAAAEAMARAHGFFTHDGTGVLQAKLMRQGFSLIAEHTIYGEPDARIVRDFEIRQWWWLHDPEAAFEQSFDAATGGPRDRARAAKLRDYARSSETRYAYRKTVRGLVYSRPYSIRTRGIA